MSDLIVIQPQVTQLEITEIDNTVTVASVGVQGPKGDTGATGAQGPSGVVAVTAPITNSGTSTSANIGIDQTGITIAESQVTNLVTDLANKVPTSQTISTTAPLTGGGDLSANRTLAVSAGSTSAAGVLQLTDSTSSTSITTAATPNAVKSAYDLADTKLLKYAIPSQLKYRSGYWYEPRIGSTIVTNTYTINRLFYYPLFIQENISLDRLGAECTTAVASSTFRLGLYNSDTNGVPSTLILDAGTIDTSTTGLKSITISQTLSAGFYFLAFAQQGGATNATMRAITSITGNWSPVASTTMSSSSYYTCFIQSSISGSFPSNATPTVDILNPLRMQFRIA